MERWSLPTLWDKNEKNHPLVKSRAHKMSLLVPGHRQHLWTCWELKGCSGTLASFLRLLPASRRTGTTRVLKSHGRFTQACRAQHRAEFYLCCTWRVKTKARFSPEFFWISPTLKTLQFWEERTHGLLPTGWTSHVSYMVILCGGQHKGNRVSLREAFPGLFATQSSPLTKSQTSE